MVELLSKIVGLVRDPVLVAVVLSFGLTVILIWKLFDKQYEFVQARLDMMQRENEELRKQIAVFRQENERLRQATQMISIVVEDLRAQPQKIERQLAEIDTLGSQLAKGMTARDAQVEQLKSFFDATLIAISNQNSQFTTIQSGFERLELALQKLGPSRELVQLIRQTLQALRDNQHRSLASLDEIEGHAAAFLAKTP